MKLNRRVWVVIVPVVSFCYALVFYSLFAYQRDSYLEQQRTRLQMDLSRLAVRFDRYDNFADVMLTSFLESAALGRIVEDQDLSRRVYSLERGLSRVVAGLTTFGFNTFNLLIVGADGVPVYENVQSDDPFASVRAELTGDIHAAVDNRIARRNAIHWRDREALISRITVIDPHTMRAPVAGQWGRAITVGLLFDLRTFDLLRQQIGRDDGVRLSRLTGDDDPIAARVSASSPLGDQLRLRIELDDGIVAREIGKLAAQLVGVYLAVCIVSALLLVHLIGRFITRPVMKLENAIRNVDRGGGSVPRPTQVNDEISSLADSFASLYEQRMRVYRETRERSEVDVLTGLHNRIKFNERVEAIIKASPAGEQVGLLYIDLDNFKFVNDTQGHETGDQLLVAFAERLSGTLRLDQLRAAGQTDIARLSGDEFAVVLGGVTSDAMPAGIARRILDLFQHGFGCNAGQFPISASIGIAVFPRDGGDARTLLVNADAAMYQAKFGGKNQHAFFSAELAERTRRAAQIEAMLKIRDFSELSMNYQLLIDTATGTSKGVEALVRWHSPTLGHVSPGEFIPIAESRGLSLPLDLWVVGRVIGDIPALKEMLGDDAVISINISSAQLESDEFFFQLMQLVTGSDVDSRQIVLEITETFAASMSKRISANLNLLRQAGFRLALDDFGAGYTSLLQLMNYPIDIIKIDKLMVDRLDDDGRDLVPALIQFCRQQGLKVTAEGVETARQATALAQAGVDSLQGYLFARPVPLAQLPEAIDALAQLDTHRWLAHDE